MIRSSLLLFIILSVINGSINNDKRLSKLKAMEHVKMGGKQAEKIEQLHYGWYIQAISGLLGSVGKEMYMKMKRSERRAFVACLDGIEKEYDIEAGAKCLVKAFDGKLTSEFATKSLDPKLDFLDRQESLMLTKVDIKKIEKNKRKRKLVKAFAKSEASKVLKKMQKKKLRKAKLRQLLRRNIAGKLKMTPKMIAKMRGINIYHRVKRNVLSLYSNKEAVEEGKRVEKADRGPYRPKNMKKMPSLMETKKSAVKHLTEMIREFVVEKNSTKSLKTSYSSLKKLQDAVIEGREKSQFKNRMLDMVIGKNHPLRRTKSFTDRLRDITPDGIVDENVYGLVDTVSKHSKDLNVNFLSPRFLSIMPEKFQTKKKLLSPDLFPLYKDEGGENSILPLPNVLETAGLNSGDRESILELVMDVSGVNTVVDDALNLVQGLRKQGLDSDLYDMTRLIDDAYSSLASTLTKTQNLDMTNKKFSFMTLDQMKRLYGDAGIYNTSVADLPFDPLEVDVLTTQQKTNSIRETIRLLASGKLGQYHQQQQQRRSKRQTIELLNGAYKVVFLNPTTLSPLGFAPTINQLSVLGPLVLSPQIFCPSILSPLLLSPPVISPQVGNPLIFSPYVLGPNVLSAAVFNAYVFSPYVLSPNVINPYVLSPLILSPFVLCPDVLSPTVLSGVVLSPSVLSPSIFTDSALAANVLSPTFLS